jgi:hypothetical protein
LGKATIGEKKRKFANLPSGIDCSGAAGIESPNLAAIPDMRQILYLPGRY